MYYSRKYSRNFISLKQDDSKHNLDFRPSLGRCLVEIKEQKGKITVYAQGIKPKVDYHLELMGFDKDGLKSAYMGKFSVDEYGKGEFNNEFNPDNVADSNGKIEDFNIVALMVDDEKVSSALVGYVGGEVKWKDKYKIMPNRYCEPVNLPEDKPTELPMPKPPVNIPLEPPTNNINEVEQGLIEKEQGLIEKQQGLIEREKSIIQKEESGNNLSLADFEISLLDKEEGLIAKEKGLIGKESGLEKKEEAVRQGNYTAISENLIQKEFELLDVEKVLIAKEEELIAREQEVIRKDPKTEKEKGLIEKEKGLLQRELGIIAKEKALINKEESLLNMENDNRENNNIQKQQENKKQQDTQKTENKIETKENSQQSNSQTFKDMVKNLKKSMENIESVKTTSNKNIDYMKFKNASMNPFKNEYKTTTWYRMSPYELMALPQENYKYYNNPFVFSCYKKFKHLMFGVKKENNQESYILAIPCQYDENFEAVGELQKFDKFIPIESGVNINSIKNETYGYRIINI